MTAVWIALFIGAAAAVGWVYVGYPVLLLARRALGSRPVRRAPIRPSVSVVVAAHDEEAMIAAKIRNTLELEWPADRIELLVVSDGSTDGTSAIVAGWPDPRVRLLALPRVGKVEALNQGAADARGDVLVFTDANTELAGDALVHLIEPLADPDVGGASGRKAVSAGGGGTGRAEGLYWGIEDRLKSLESYTGSVFAADGGLYAIRRELYSPIVDPAQADDIAISARVVLQGHRLVHCPTAVGREAPPESAAAEYRRKVRVTNHSLRALLGLGSALWTSGFYSVQLVSHKLLRHLTPVFLLALLVSSAALAARSAPFAAALLAQAAFYALAAAGLLLRRTRAGRHPALAGPFWFCLACAAALKGLVSVLTGRRVRAWTPRGDTERPSTTAPFTGDRS